MARGYKQLTYADRLRIDTLLRHKHSVKEMAEEIGCSQATIYNELKRATYIHTNSDLTEEKRYNPEEAERKYQQHLREKGRKLTVQEDTEFIEYVEYMILEKHYSPEAVLLEIKRDNLDFQTKISVGTLYNYIRRGIFPNLKLADCPMPRKKKTGKKRKVQKRDSAGTSIEKRPESINNKEEVGHWEMDSVVGPRGKSKKSLLVLSERKTRQEIVILLRTHTAEEVVKALDRLERDMGEKQFRERFKSITVDNGVEFSDNEGMERSRRNKRNRTKVYYCHPYSSWERALNENQNRFIRRFVPKGVNFDGISKREVKAIEAWMNDYPRGTFDGKSAGEVYEMEFQATGGGCAA